VRASALLSNGRKITFLNVNKSRNLSGKLDAAAGQKFSNIYTDYFLKSVPLLRAEKITQYRSQEESFSRVALKSQNASGHRHGIKR